MSDVAESNSVHIKKHSQIDSSNLSPLSVTPPDKSSQLPPSPPPTTERPGKRVVNNDDDGLRLPEPLLQHKLLSLTQEVSKFTKFKLSPEQYHKLHSKIEKTFRCFDYEPRRGCLAIRMPSPTHGFFAIEFRDEVCKELNQIATSRTDKIKEVTRELKSAISSRVFLREVDEKEQLDEDNEADDGNEYNNKKEDDYKKYAIKREPDIQFQYPKTAYPGVVVEVSYSQNGKDLRRLAQDYILYSNADVKLFIGFDLSYDGGSSTVSTWRPKFINDGDDEDLVTVQYVQDRPFLSCDGQVQNPDEVLTIDVRDFATDEISKTWPDAEINIKFSRLAQLFNDAQQWQLEKETAKSSQVMKSKRVSRKRRLPSSSPQRLRSDDEEQIREWEQAVDLKSHKADADYVGDDTEDDDKRRLTKRRS
ncbi:hypothetical protein FPOAC2_04085 [Fusarium poae]|uniref:Uncharacterized protein n=1 Tax=Fusarium poae TaxID=36050 RepID=A0A1B8A832_FUSPO|nr:hypothetical protein FPOAC1_004020 [Fusarium poae]KAG8670786.1 hypothetical protein FPOAC1_004020 [Fusarium poae]OBS16640.1 hypothetical protein FPOA_12745 [Fusarium poae]OBS16647.1 hypothetical protein FPOA_12740 [Fusarium poae]OBS17160.1 hypothetical protein FPOA_12313 [Fusarium poae]